MKILGTNPATYCIGSGSLLEKHLKAGTLWMEGDAIVGYADGGTLVQLGNCDTLQAMFETEEYLKSHPTPEDW